MYIHQPPISIYSFYSMNGMEMNNTSSMEMGSYQLGLITVVLVLVISHLWKLFRVLIWRPYVLTKGFEKQGVRGPPYKLISGSLNEIKSLKEAAKQIPIDAHSHDINSRIQPHYTKWSSIFGDVFLYWFGTEPRIYIADAELAKQVLSKNFTYYTTPELRPTIVAMLGKGLPLINGLEWAKHRRVVNPAFNIDKLKVMTKRMAACTISKLDKWSHQLVQSEGQIKEIEMRAEFQDLTGDIIAHTAFGSSYTEGKEVFEAQQELQRYAVASSTDIFIPGSQYVPTHSNRQIWKLVRIVKNKLRKIIQGRLDSQRLEGGDSGHGDDLLALMMGVSETASRKQESPKLNMDEIVEECRTFFFAGHETTSNLLTWTVFLLSIDQEWQERLRQEVLKECGNETPDTEMLNKLKLVNMVLLEALRLYTPVLELLRKPSGDIKLGNLMIPKDTIVTIPLTMIHRSEKYWGEDANEFNPWRFKDGISKAATHPNALLSFSIGHRACIGQNFAMMEAKMVIALILQRFSLSLSPAHTHAPVDNLTLQPQFGLPVLIRPVRACLR